MDHNRWRKQIRDDWLMTTIGVSGWMFLLVPARPGRPIQNPKRQLVCLCQIPTTLEFKLQHIPSIRTCSFHTNWRYCNCSRGNSHLVVATLRYTRLPQPTPKSYSKIKHTSNPQLVLRNFRSTPVPSLLTSLHWLPDTSSIKYKTAAVTYKSLSVSQPTYHHL